MVNGGRWTEDEHDRFLEGMKSYGRAWKAIANEVVKTRTPEQVRIHAQKHYQKQEKQKRLSSGKQSPTKDGHWTEEEHQLFLKCWAKYGKSWKKVAEIMKTRSNEQIRTHAQKYFNKLRELRSRGYGGPYQMNGIRHLTKTFVQKNHPPCSTEGIPVFASSKKYSSRSKRKSTSSSSSSSSQGPKKSKKSIGRRLSKDDDDDEDSDDDQEEEWEGDDDDEDGEDMDVKSHRSRPRTPRPLTYTTRSGRTVTANWKEDEEYYEESEEGEEEEEGTDHKEMKLMKPKEEEEEDDRTMMDDSNASSQATTNNLARRFEEEMRIPDGLDTLHLYGPTPNSRYFFNSDDEEEMEEEENKKHHHQHLGAYHHSFHPHYHHHYKSHGQSGHYHHLHHAAAGSPVLPMMMREEDMEEEVHSLGHLIFDHGDVLVTSTSSMNDSLPPHDLYLASSSFTDDHDAAQRFEAEIDEWVKFTSSGAVGGGSEEEVKQVKAI